MIMLLKGFFIRWFVMVLQIYDYENKDIKNIFNWIYLKRKRFYKEKILSMEKIFFSFCRKLNLE